jgi:hypothetical protein
MELTCAVSVRGAVRSHFTRALAGRALMRPRTVSFRCMEATIRTGIVTHDGTGVRLRLESGEKAVAALS